MRRGALAIVALLAIAANLRGPLTSLPPLVDRISESLGLSSVAAGGLTSLPLLCMGLLAPLAPRLAVRYGLEKALGLGIALIAVGTAGRALAGAPGLYAGTVVLGTGIAIAGALVPAAVRQAVPGNIGGATSLSNVVTMTMAALAAATVTPLADRVGAPAALAVWAIPALAALVLWIPQMRGSAPSDGRARPGGRTPAGGSAPATNSAPAPSRAAAGSSAPATDSAGAAG
ncbi:MAG TPA: MFS transporter, partial [Beutenbergiaceae bacterium]|nr:MFS transporter [Beutenbergiaceae bacterium]